MIRWILICFILYFVFKVLPELLRQIFGAFSSFNFDEDDEATYNRLNTKFEGKTGRINEDREEFRQFQLLKEQKERHEKSRQKAANRAKRFTRLAWIVVPIIIGVIVFAHSPIKIKNDEEAIRRRFGHYIGNWDAGWKWRIPFIDKVDKVATQSQKQLMMGMRLLDEGPPPDYERVDSEALMLTADENIVGVERVHQYRITNPAYWVFNVNDPEGTMRDADQAATRMIVGDNGIDEVMTIGKFEMQARTKKTYQEILDGYLIGATIVSTFFQDVYPPVQADSAFKDVATANEDKLKVINDGEKFYKKMIPSARGDSAETVNTAIGDAKQRIEYARGDSASFVQQWVKYKEAPEITRKRMLFETLTKLYANHRVVIVDEELKNLLTHLNLKEGKGVDK